MNGQLLKRMAQAYGRHSEGYARVLEPTLQPMAAEILRIGAVSGRDCVMDLATGTGLIARAAALVSSSVVGVDISPGVLVAARESSGGDIPFVVADAGALPFSNQSFDLVTCGISLSHFPDVLGALGEVRRVLRPGGRFVASAWGSEEDDPSLPAALDVLDRHMGKEANPFAELLDEETWASSEQGCEVLQQAGFEKIQVTTLPSQGVYPSPATAAEWAFTWPLIAERVDRLDPATRDRLLAEATAAVKAANDLSWHYAINYYKGKNSRPMNWAI